jgi:hypothetical protein
MRCIIRDRGDGAEVNSQAAAHKTHQAKRLMVYEEKPCSVQWEWWHGRCDASVKSRENWTQDWTKRVTKRKILLEMNMKFFLLERIRIFWTLIELCAEELHGQSTRIGEEVLVFFLDLFCCWWCSDSFSLVQKLVSSGFWACIVPSIINLQLKEYQRPYCPLKMASVQSPVIRTRDRTGHQTDALGSLVQWSNC